MTQDSRAPRRSRSTLLLAALVPILVALVVLTVLLTLRVTSAQSRAEAYAAVRAAARVEAAAFINIDYQTFDEDLDQILAGATGEVKERYAAGRDAFKANAVENKRVYSGRVLQVGVVSLDEDSARVLLTANAAVTDSALASPERSIVRYQLDLVYQDGQWLTSGAEFVF